MKTTLRSSVLAIATLTFGCQSGTGLFNPFASSSQYTIVYSDSGPRSYDRSVGGFYSFLNQTGPAGRWTTVFLIGDSLRVTEFLLSGTQCPEAMGLAVGTDTLAADSATVIVSHKRIRRTVPDPSVSVFTIDSLSGGVVWGQLSISVHQIVPEFGGPNATLTGRFRLSEIEYMGQLRHCGSAA
jgi:hypothetical protein